jgi:K+-transporting ATPase ATPase C chain
MTEQLKIALWFTLLTTVIFGLGYPLAVTGLARIFFPKQADGSIVATPVAGGSTLMAYFHPRPSAAGTGYDPRSSTGSNLAPTNHQLTDRVAADLAKLQEEKPGVPVPIDLVTTSASGLDPDFSPAAARFHIPRVAKTRKIPTNDLLKLEDSQVLELNRALDAHYPQER